MKGEKEIYSIDYIIIGDTNVGKTNIIYRYRKGEFLSDDITATVGLEFSSKFVEINNRIFQLKVWDTAGMDKYESIRKGFYKNAACAIIVYDITEKKTLESVDKWIEECKENSGNILLKVLVANKSDLIKEGNNYEEEGKNVQNRYDIDMFFVSSALTGYNINKIFTESIKKLYETISNEENEGKEFQGIKKINEKINPDESISIITYEEKEKNKNIEDKEDDNDNHENLSSSCFII